MSIWLFHGPRSRAVALERAEAHGRLLQAFDDLKVDVSREITEKLLSPPIGDGKASLLMGPLDEATPEAADGLLKTLEENKGDSYIRPFLWALDLGGVIPTIRSRTLHEWCPGDLKHTPESPYLPLAASLCEAALKRRVAAVLEILMEHKGQEPEILRASAEFLIKKTEWPLDKRLLLWESLRKTLQYGEPSYLAAVTAFLV